jgi:hypothetical protein
MVDRGLRLAVEEEMVAVGPGAMAFTVMSLPRISLASTWVMASMPPLVAA